MADQHVDDSGIQWIKAVSKNGVPFEYGTRKSDLASESIKTAGTPEGLEHGAQAAIEGDWTTVNWPVGENTWNDTVGLYGISRYALYYNGIPNIFSYTLDFTNTAFLSFDFQDESGDVYPVLTARNSDHWLKYNSKAPIIIAFKGYNFTRW